MSCSKTVKKSDSKVVDVLPFPKIVDRLKNEEVKLASEKWLNCGDHYTYYFGNMNDTIEINGYLQPYIPIYPPDPREANYQNKNSKYSEYFIKWQDNRSFEYTESAELLIKIDTTQFINNEGRKAYPVLIMNKSLDTVYIGNGSVVPSIPIITEAKSQKGEWKEIEKYDSSCYLGFGSIILPPNEIVITSVLKYSGKFTTKMRVKINNNFSEEFNGRISESQFESEWDSQGNKKTLPNNVSYVKHFPKP